MTSSEQVQHQYLTDCSLPRQTQEEHAGQKLLSDAYERGDSKGGEHLLDGQILNKIFHSRKIGDNNKSEVKKDVNMDDKKGVKLEKEGNIESLKIPGGFSKASASKEDNFFQFNCAANKDTKVCYWRRGDFSADDDDRTSIDEVLKKPPHVLTEQETLDLMPMMNPGRPWGNANYKDLSLRSEVIGDRPVLVADFQFNDQDKRVHLIIANQDRDKHQIENIWVEGPAKDFDKNNKAVLDAFRQIKWTEINDKSKK